MPPFLVKYDSYGIAHEQAFDTLEDAQGFVDGWLAERAEHRARERATAIVDDEDGSVVVSFEGDGK